MKLVGAVFRTNEMRCSLWNGALYCETFCKECCGCQNVTFTKFQKENRLFCDREIHRKQDLVSKEASSYTRDFLT